ncbi:glycosyltransferase [Primorskyibacter sp. S187A]|uniref:glycosyltransferase n=1 Tax=Primorskyibacter sp. S187A TaxID=3415130 RepID=UPI003C7A6690
MSKPDLVLIGRNEGARLERCLASAQGLARRLVYVDSGSTDASVEKAEQAGAEVVHLDPSQPFTAARARHAGFLHLEKSGGAAEIVQFIDGDCEIVEGWIPAGVKALEADPALGLVTGWRSEMMPEASLYNALCHVEWRRPAGEIMACGGDMMVRAEAYRNAGGFNAQVIAAEDDELCCRLRKTGHTLKRLPLEMTRHDAAMRRFGQWWQRAVRTGHGFEQVNDLHPDYFKRERMRMWVYGGLLPLLALTGFLTSWWLVLGVAAVYAASYVRTVQGLQAHENLAPADARRHAGLLTLSKLPNILGALRYRGRKWFGRDMSIIEYK